MRERELAPVERPEQAISIDLETTGLTSTPLFLIGAMVWEDGGSTCVSIAYAGDPEAFEDALEDWQDRTGGTVEREDGRAVLSSCS